MLVLIYINAFKHCDWVIINYLNNITNSMIYIIFNKVSVFHYCWDNNIVLILIPKYIGYAH